MRTNPKVRALCQRVRRPTIGILAGFGLIAPASAFVVYDDPDVEIVVVDVDPAAELLARETVVAAWRQGVIDRERQQVSRKFAERFRIPADLADDIYWAAVKERIDPQLAFRLVRAESSFKPSAVSPVGAVGLTQVMPATANWLFPGTRRDDLMVPRFNLRVGFRYLRHLLDTYDDPHLALLAYNRGPGRVDSLIDAGEDPGNGYPELVLTGDRTRHAAFVASTRAAAAVPDAPAAEAVPERRKTTG
ncbi:MAG TPA: lytic transglycosylase domain-containing protein [Longimicrobiales bacterium]|nr:lytic transglycosylase domain-containing protein [Longimicrobiales bacterium]